ncbi:MAG TPA: DUF3187 family protein [Thermodesulfovibrionales bacterium]|nr:DUF3187 family protein [Thermodesulfovibrionales bacterium]
MKNSIANLSTLLFLLFLASPATSFEGPLQVKNQFPLFVFLNPPYLERALPEDSLSVILSYSSDYMVKSSSDWSVGLDMETTELSLRYKKKIVNSFELGIDVPFLSFNSGFLDHFLSDYHRTFGFSDYGRSNRPANTFLYEMSKNGKLLIQADNGTIGLGDIRLTAKKALLLADPVVSLMADIELPTGSASKGFGSGGIDTGIAVLIDKRLGEKVMLYGNVGVVFTGDLKWKERVKLRDSLYGGVCVEAAPWKNFSLLGQAVFQSSPFPETGIPSLDRLSVLLSFGGRYSRGENIFELSLTEDPNTAGAPDFTVVFAFKRKL